MSSGSICSYCLLPSGHAGWCEHARPDSEWLAFARNQLPRQQIPTPQEAGEAVVTLRTRLREVTQALRDTQVEVERERTANREAMRQFTREVEALAVKWERGT